MSRSLRFGNRSVISLALALALGGAIAGAGCGGSSDLDNLPGVAGDLLAGKKPLRARGLDHPERVTNGVLAMDGDGWQTEVTSVLHPDGQAVYDLGASTPIECGALQGDNNDSYILEGSEDGEAFTPLWTAGPVHMGGMQIRYATALGKRARYVRLTAHGGDNYYSLGEIALYARCPAEWPPRLVQLKEAATPYGDSVKGTFGLLAICCVAFLLLSRRHAARWMQWAKLGAGALTLYFGFQVARELFETWPQVDYGYQSAARALCAVLAATIVLREYFAPTEYPVSPRSTAAALIAISVVSVACYFHFGVPQFRDESKGRITMVHPWDMRVYFPVAKYFRELRFDGLYVASVAAYLDNHPGMPESQVAGVRLRNLHDNHMQTASETMDEIRSVHERFTPERWESFKKDMKYFEDVMGPGGYLGSLQDHGGNATPVWILGAWVLFRNAPANETTLTLTAFIDPLLLALLFFVVARTYGARAMLILMIVFGSSDFSLFTDSNLMGSTLRTDWMVAAGLGACALKRGRYALGGGLIAYGGLIRAFPALAAIFLAVPALWWAIDRWRAGRPLPTLGEVRTQQRATLRAIAGAAGVVVVLVGISSALFTWEGSWGDWTKKILVHAEKPNANHLGLRNLVAYSSDREARKVVDDKRLEPWSAWQDMQRETFAERKPLFYLGVLAFFAAAAIAARGKRLDQAAMLGLLLIPVFFYPANYYCLYVFLIPLLGTPDGDPIPLLKPEGQTLFGWISGVVLAMGVVQPFTLKFETDVTYTQQSLILLTAVVLILWPLARDAWPRPWKIPREDEEEAAARRRSGRGGGKHGHRRGGGAGRPRKKDAAVGAI